MGKSLEVTDFRKYEELSLGPVKFEMLDFQMEMWSGQEREVDWR